MWLRSPNVVLDEKRRMRMAMDIARGMNYLHSCVPPIVHRDLKSPNLLVDKDFTIKACLSPQITPHVSRCNWRRKDALHKPAFLLIVRTQYLSQNMSKIGDRSGLPQC